jgi:hypothetical protein
VLTKKCYNPCNFFELLLTSIPGILLISVDFEGAKTHASQRTMPSEMGISIFDTKYLDCGSSHFHNAALEHRGQNMLVTRHYQSIKKKKRDYRYFRFGESEPVDPDKFATISRQLFYMDKELLSPERDIRPIILVGQSIHEDIATMIYLGVNIRDAPSLMFDFDTQLLSYEVLGKAPKSQNSLQGIMRRLGLRSDWYLMHNAGNDANFSLRTALMLVARKMEKSKIDKASEWKAELFRSIATAPIPEVSKFGLPLSNPRLGSPDSKQDDPTIHMISKKTEERNSSCNFEDLTLSQDKGGETGPNAPEILTLVEEARQESGSGITEDLISFSDHAEDLFSFTQYIEKRRSDDTDNLVMEYGGENESSHLNDLRVFVEYGVAKGWDNTEDLISFVGGREEKALEYTEDLISIMEPEEEKLSNSPQSCPSWETWEEHRPEEQVLEGFSFGQPLKIHRRIYQLYNGPGWLVWATSMIGEQEHLWPNPLGWTLDNSEIAS